jgi:hypothetical protein
MAARAALHSLIEDDPTLLGLGVETVYSSNAVDTPSEECFIVVRWDSTEAAFKTVGRDRCSIWVHDKNRDYGRINEALRRIKDLLTDTTHRVGADGWTLTTAEWNGEGPDLLDNGFNTVTRFSDFTVVGRYSTT